MKAKRPQIQVDATPEYKQKLKVIAATEGKSLRQLVLDTLREKYPNLPQN